MDDLKTRVFCVDMPQDVIDYLVKEQLEVCDFQVGPALDARDLNYHWDILPVTMQFQIPDNLHEYSVIVQDLAANSELIPYDKSKNFKQRAISDTNDRYKCLCLEKTQNIFDPLPFACRLIGNDLRHKKGKLIRILFQSEKYYVNYKCIKADGYCSNIGNISNYESIIDFTHEALSGNRVKLKDEYELAHNLFEGLEDQLSYSQTFRHPTFKHPDSYKEEPSANFIPLLLNAQDDIISYVYFEKNGSVTFMLPQIQDKKSLLERLFSDCLYKHFSDFFPLQTKNSWLENENYELPEIVQLKREKEEALKNYVDVIKNKDESIAELKQNYAFLYSMLTESGDELVKNVKLFLEWLGFADVRSMDASVKEGEDFEEDLQILLDNNELLIVEVKGLYGTSKDNECSQISKIESRRIHEKKYSMVHSLYIVNNERGKEPLKRQIPPFTDHQIKDAQYSCRAMAYTYQLFNLYFEIENGILTKDEARKAFLQDGLVDFHANFKELGMPYKYFSKMTVVCIELHDSKISVGDIIYYEDASKRMKSTRIVSIQEDNESLESAINGRIGIGVDQAVTRNTVLYIKK